MTTVASSTSSARHRARRIAGILAIGLMALTLVACSSKTPQQQAGEALEKGLQAHIAGNIDEAKKQYQECLKQDAANKLCHYNLGLIAQTAGDVATAESEYRLALTVDPAYGPALFNLAIIRTNAGSTAEAIDLYKKYITTKPEDAGGHLNLGLLLIKAGDVEGGNAQIVLAIGLDPNIKVPLASPRASTAPQPSATPQPSASPKK